MKSFDPSSNRIAVLGLGYVGLPLSLLLARNFLVTGFDIDEKRVYSIKNGVSPIEEPGINDLLLSDAIRKNITFTSNPDDISHATVKIITVGTPFDLSTRYIDYSQIESSLSLLKNRIHRGDIIILKSTVPPGTTNGIIRDRILKMGLSVPEDVGLIFSPERMVEGQAINDFLTLPKVIGASDPETMEIGKEIIGSLGGTVIEVSTIEAAEMVKMVDNYSRYVFLALTNEIALACEKIGADVIEVINAAKKDYPRNAGILKPGPGVGGSCLNKDPFILEASMKKLNLDLKMVKSAEIVNRKMAEHVSLLVKKFSGQRKKIVIAGVAFKGDTNDTRFSTTYEIEEDLKASGYDVKLSDPYVVENTRIGSDIYQDCKDDEIILLMTDHSQYTKIDLKKIKDSMAKEPLILDMRAIIPKKAAEEAGFEYHGLGRL
jgi:UDP-N-acetyl-D-mannosaminuronic acid dehydrogenase